MQPKKPILSELNKLSNSLDSPNGGLSDEREGSTESPLVDLLAKPRNAKEIIDENRRSFFKNLSLGVVAVAGVGTVGVVTAPKASTVDYQKVMDTILSWFDKFQTEGYVIEGLSFAEEDMESIKKSMSLTEKYGGMWHEHNLTSKQKENPLFFYEGKHAIQVSSGKWIKQGFVQLTVVDKSSMMGPVSRDSFEFKLIKVHFELPKK